MYEYMTLYFELPHLTLHFLHICCILYVHQYLKNHKHQQLMQKIFSYYM